MPPFPKPKFEYAFDVKQQVSLLRAHKKARQIPKREKSKLLVATWNVANLGLQERGDEHLALIAEVMGWFDVVAVQECRENFGDLFDIVAKLGRSYRALLSDNSGNDERMAFVYDARRLGLLEEVGEIAFPAAELKHVKLPGIARAFAGFDRTPYFASFRAGRTSLTLVNAHLFYGSEAKDDVERRTLETFAVAKWADGRRKSAFAFTRELAALGDFNLPKAEPGDPIFDALTRLGLEVPAHSSEVGSAIASDAQYDQVAFFPGTTRNCFTGLKGVVDYDAALFPDLWDGGRRAADFQAYCRYYISDHRPMWVQLAV